ncbi:MAG: YicC/YloC family endoribonuclease [Hyphomicrobiaceae bacterium]
MSLASMTGFGRAEGAFEGHTWAWEVRSVNGRGLDLRLRLPPGSDALEPRLREAVAQRFSRGSINVALQYQRDSGGSEIRLNEAALKQVLQAAAAIGKATGNTTPPSAEALLAVKGVIEIVEPTEDEATQRARHDAMIGSLEHALDDLKAARAAEGQRLTVVLSDQVAEIERLVAVVSQSPSRTPEAIAARLEENVQRITSGSSSLDPDRLHQEAILIATRADVEEEIQRLKAHLAAARELIDTKGSVGRKLDFLVQEFNREANTLCSKANAADISRAGLSMKAVIDQMREQVQNIE